MLVLSTGLLNQSRDLPFLSLSSDFISHLIPPHRHAPIPLIAPAHHDPKLVPRRAEVVPALVAEADDDRAHDVADAKALRQLHPVLLRGTYILRADEAAEWHGDDAGGADDQDRAVGVRAREACDARVDLCAYRWEERCWLRSRC